MAGVYRLWLKSHTLSARFCIFVSPKSRACHPKHEAHLSVESDGDCGFHGAAPRCWQLLSFYRAFDPRRMLQAKLSEDHDALEQYFETL
jgi:hypothetical protein